MKRTLISFVYLWFCFLATDASGQTWLWGKGSKGVASDAWAIATDQSGNVFGAGYTYTSGADTFGSIVVPSSLFGSQSIWAKYDGSGNVLWAGGTVSGNTTLYNIATDPAGNLIVFGAFSSSTMQIGPFTLTNAYSGTAWQYYLAKISPTGTVLWAICDGNTIGTYYCFLSACILGMGGVTTDNAGNIYITSSFLKPTMTIESVTLTNSGGSDIFVAKYNPSGALIWAKSAGGTGDDYAFAVTATSAGSVYITGAFTSPSMTFGPSTVTNPFSSGTPIVPYAYIGKFSAATGTPLWGQAAGGGRGAFGSGIEKDASGNIYITGGFADNSISFGSATISQTYPSSVAKLALFLVQYSPGDVVSWHKTIGSPIQSLWGYSIAMASCGQVWVSGNYNELANIDGNILPLASGPDPVFIAGYNLSGGVIGYSGLGSGGDDQNGIAADANGNIFICSDYKDIPFPIGPDVLPYQLDEHFYIGKYANTVALPDTNYTSQNVYACGSAVAVLSANAGYATYLWDNGITVPTRTVSASGTYWVYNVTCGVPVVIDTFHLTISPFDTAFTSNDVSTCEGLAPATLPAPGGYTSYLWSNGNTATSIVTATAGTYIAYCQSGCNILADTFNFVITPNDSVFSRTDTALCSIPGALTLTGPDGYVSYIWSNGGNTQIITTTKAGNTILVAQNGCNVLVDTFNLTLRGNPLVNLGNDIKLFNGSTVNLFSPEPTSVLYTWNTGEHTPYITVSEPGTYWLTVTNEWGCTGSDTVRVTDTVESDIELPNAFSPDGVNTIFKIIVKGEVKLHYFRIYNRWGNLVFETTDIQSGWDGKYNGVPQMLDVYVYQIEAVRNSGAVFTLAGNVTLIR